MNTPGFEVAGHRGSVENSAQGFCVSTLPFLASPTPQPDFFLSSGPGRERDSFSSPGLGAGFLEPTDKLTGLPA